MDIMVIIKWILLFVILAIVAWLLFFGPGKQLLVGIGLLGGLPKEAQEGSETNFDIAVQNIGKCSGQETDCLCEFFPSWPASFATGSKITIEILDKDTRINWSHTNKVYRTITLSSTIITAKEIETIETNQEVPLAPLKTLEFQAKYVKYSQKDLGSKGFPITGWGKKEYKVVSGYLYKGSQGKLYLLISSKDVDKLSELEPVINNMKKCSS